jgi:hypothetical protein
MSTQVESLLEDCFIQSGLNPRAARRVKNGPIAYPYFRKIWAFTSNGTTRTKSHFPCGFSGTGCNIIGFFCKMAVNMSVRVRTEVDEVH